MRATSSVCTASIVHRNHGHVNEGRPPTREVKWTVSVSPSVRRHRSWRTLGLAVVSFAVALVNVTVLSRFEPLHATAAQEAYHDDYRPEADPGDSLKEGRRQS